MSLEDQHDALTGLLAQLRRQETDLVTQIGRVSAELTDVRHKLAAAAETDIDLIRWSALAPGEARLVETLATIHPALVGFRHWSTNPREGDVFLLPEIALENRPIDHEYAEQVATALYTFQRRFGSFPVPTGDDRPTFIECHNLPDGRFPVLLRWPLAQIHDWEIEVDPNTNIAVLIPGKSRPYAGQLPQVLMTTMKRMRQYDAFGTVL